MGMSVVNYDPVESEILVNGDLDLEDHGFSGKIIHTPGHTSGSLSILLEDHKALVGDTIFNASWSGIYPPFIQDEEELMRSWKLLEGSGIREFYPAHGKILDRERFLKAYKKYSDRKN